MNKTRWRKWHKKKTNVQKNRYHKIKGIEWIIIQKLNRTWWRDWIKHDKKLIIMWHKNHLTNMKWTISNFRAEYEGRTEENRWYTKKIKWERHRTSKKQLNVHARSAKLNMDLSCTSLKPWKEKCQTFFVFKYKTQKPFLVKFYLIE